MMKIRFVTTLGALAILAVAACTAQATVLEFGNHSNNEDMLFNYGSNIVVAVADEFDISNGTTPDVTLAWGPAGSTNVLEFHNSGNWIAPMSGGKLQLDVDASSQTAFPRAPTIDFLVPAGISVAIDSFMLGHAKDMHIADGHEPAHDWIISVINLDTNATVMSHSTTALGVALAGDGAVETVNLNFVGLPGVGYRLLFDDTGDDSLFPSNHDGTPGNHPRGGLDNITFRQIAIPEPSTIALLALCGVAGLAKRRRS